MLMNSTVVLENTSLVVLFNSDADSTLSILTHLIIFIFYCVVDTAVYKYLLTYDLRLVKFFLSN